MQLLPAQEGAGQWQAAWAEGHQANLHQRVCVHTMFHHMTEGRQQDGRVMRFVQLLTCVEQAEAIAHILQMPGMLPTTHTAAQAHLLPPFSPATASAASCPNTDATAMYSAAMAGTATRRPLVGLDRVRVVLVRRVAGMVRVKPTCHAAMQQLHRGFRS